MTKKNFDNDLPRLVTFSIGYFGSPAEFGTLEIIVNAADASVGGRSSKADYTKGEFSSRGFEMMSSVSTGEGFCFGFARNDLERVLRFLHKKAEARRRCEESGDDED